MYTFRTIRWQAACSVGQRHTDLRRLSGTNRVCRVRRGHPLGKALTLPDASVTLTKATLDSIQLKETTVEAASAKGELTFGRRQKAFGEFMGLLDTFPPWFNTVTR